MSRATKILAGTTVLGFLTSIWLYLDNESLREEVAEKTEAVAKLEAPKTDEPQDEWLDAKKPRDGKIGFAGVTPQPSLPAEKKEHRLDRRQRRTEEFGAMFGRNEGETEEEWRARVTPLIQAGLFRRRERTAENRKIAEEKAKVTPEQSAKIDKAMEKIYDDVLSYTNKAIQDGQLSPYERNVAGWLDYAGGLGSILHDAQGQVGKILDPSQMKTMYESGFEWGEYLGFNAPWEKITAPPTRK
jgi:hypothetical protein